MFVRIVTFALLLPVLSGCAESVAIAKKNEQQIITNAVEMKFALIPAGEFRMPTEAEWEYAARAGTDTKFSFGDDESRLGEYAWFDKNSLAIGEKFAHAVGRKLANPWNLYDMHGNVREWCSDFYDEKYYGVSPGSDPQGPGHGLRPRLPRRRLVQLARVRSVRVSRLERAL